MICTKTCTYQGVKNVIFLENFAYILNKWPLLCSLESRYYISLMDVAQSSIYITLYYNCSKLLISLFSNWWYLLKTALFRKTMSVVIYAKILHQSFIPTIYENVKSIMFAYLLKRKFGNLHICLIWAIEIIKKKLGAFDGY